MAFNRLLLLSLLFVVFGSSIVLGAYDVRCGDPVRVSFEVCDCGSYNSCSGIGQDFTVIHSFCDYANNVTCSVRCIKNCFNGEPGTCGPVDISFISSVSGNGCASGASNPTCSDSRDNDGDGLIDMADPGCVSPSDNNEDNPECSNGFSDDSDGLIDMADPGCSSIYDDNEDDVCPYDITHLGCLYSTPVNSFFNSSFECFSGSCVQCISGYVNFGGSCVVANSNACSGFVESRKWVKHAGSVNQNVNWFSQVPNALFWRAKNGVTILENSVAYTCGVTYGNTVNYVIGFGSPNADMASLRSSYPFSLCSSSTPIYGSVPNTEYVLNRRCSDGIDNDGDGLIDSQDSGCKDSFGVYQSFYDSELNKCYKPFDECVSFNGNFYVQSFASTCDSNTNLCVVSGVEPKTFCSNGESTCDSFNSSRIFTSLGGCVNLVNANDYCVRNNVLGVCSSGKMCVDPDSTGASCQPIPPPCRYNGVCNLQLSNLQNNICINHYCARSGSGVSDGQVCLNGTIWNRLSGGCEQPARCSNVPCNTTLFGGYFSVGYYSASECFRPSDPASCCSIFSGMVDSRWLPYRIRDR